MPDRGGQAPGLRYHEPVLVNPDEWPGPAWPALQGGTSLEPSQSLAGRRSQVSEDSAAECPSRGRGAPGTQVRAAQVTCASELATRGDKDTLGAMSCQSGSGEENGSDVGRLVELRRARLQLLNLKTPCQGPARGGEGVETECGTHEPRGRRHDTW